MEPAHQSTAGGPDTMPFKRKIASREPPKRSSRQTAIKKQKTLVESFYLKLDFSSQILLNISMSFVES